jgi:hypothetical protein
VEAVKNISNRNNIILISSDVFDRENVNDMTLLNDFLKPWNVTQWSMSIKGPICGFSPTMKK